MRAKLRAALHAHLRRSAPVAAAAADADPHAAPLVPQWQLQCSPHDLPAFCAEMAAAAKTPGAAITSGGGAAGLGLSEGSHGGSAEPLSGDEVQALERMAADDDWASELQHELETWALIRVCVHSHTLMLAFPSSFRWCLTRCVRTAAQVLFEALPPAGESTLNEGLGGEPSSGSLLTAGAGGGGDASLALALRRQSNFSRWLQHNALPAALAAAAAAGEPCGAALQLLSAHHLAGAAAVAAAARDVRLATLLSSAGLFRCALFRRRLEAQCSAQPACSAAPCARVAGRWWLGRYTSCQRALVLDCFSSGLQASLSRCERCLFRRAVAETFTHCACGAPWLPRRRQGQALAAQQLEVWSSTGMLPKVARERLLVYRLLAGQVR